MEKFSFQLLSCTESAGMKLSALPACWETSFTALCKGKRESPTVILPQQQGGPLAFRGGSEQPHRGCKRDGDKGHPSSHRSPRHEPGFCLNLMSLFPRTPSCGGRITRSGLAQLGALRMRCPARCCLFSSSCPSSGSEG